MNKILSFQCPQSDKGVFVEGVHIPTLISRKGGLWLSAAGNALLMQDEYTLSEVSSPVWLVCEEGTPVLTLGGISIEMEKGDCVVLPANTVGCHLTNSKDARMLWITLDGALVNDYMGEMNALSNRPALLGVLPNMVAMMRQMVQVLVRHSGTNESDFQLQHLLWGLLAMHSGQTVSTVVTLSHEIARVVDTMRTSQYHDNFSLAEMAAISRMPVETFRKRFTNELGVPPLAYEQFLKMERAKTLLRNGVSVRQAGVDVGMSDPYHFSKQFKRVVGMSPTAYLKHVDSERLSRRERAEEARQRDALRESDLSRQDYLDSIWMREYYGKSDQL